MQRFTSETRLRKILERQTPERWLGDYVPAILATREEAPRISRPAVIDSTLLGRKAHLLSGPEHVMFFLASYHPALVNLHEQRMLPMEQTPHPLFGRPESIGVNLPEFKGTLNVVERLSLGFEHASFQFRFGRERITVPFPYIGDLLLFLHDEAGFYCVNWSVKDRLASFEERRPDDTVPKDPAKSRAWAHFRHTAEQLCYSDAGIRTQACVRTAVPKQLQSNLRKLYPHTLHQTRFSTQQIGDIVGAFSAALTTGMPPVEVITRISSDDRFDVEDHCRVLYQAIYRRQIRVDLYKPILFDTPLIPENTDVLDDFSAWFCR